MKKMCMEVLGWYGMVAIVFAYILVSFSIVPSNDMRYQVLNCTGAIGVATVSLYKKAYQPGVLNVIWAAIAFIAIVRMPF